MSCHELKKISQDEDREKCSSNIHHSFESPSNICRDNDFGLKMSEYKRNSLNYNFGSSISLDKFSFYTSGDESSGLSKHFSNEAIHNVCECIDDELSDNDLIEIQSTPSNFKNILYKNANRNINFDKKRKSSLESPLCENSFLNYSDAVKDHEEMDTVLDVQDIPFTLNSSTSECEQANIEECLLDLDDYLEKMDDGCFQDAGYDADMTNRSIIVMPKGVSSSIRMKNVSKTNTQFERNSKLRNTISCTLNEKKFEDEAASVYATWNKQTLKCGNKIETDIENNCDISQEMPHCSTNINKSEYSENINTLRFKCQNECANKLIFNGLQVLSNDQIFQNLIDQQETFLENVKNDRPRQFGRRAERVATLSTTLNNTNLNCEHINYDNLRPMSAPASTGSNIPEAHNAIMYHISDGSTIRTSHNTSPVSIESSTDSGESLGISDNIAEPGIIANDENNRQSALPIDFENVDESIKSGFNSYWPHNYSRTLALISCTLGLFNISRFAVLTINYGGNFLIQFLILSIIFGIPFLWLQMSLGAKIEAGPISMWKISPICVGIGISLICVQYFITIYSSVVVVWLLVYIRDIFLYHSSYPWTQFIHPIIPRKSSHIYTNLTESVPDYFNVNVLQRLQIFQISDVNAVHLDISDRVAFYLVILWAVVFLVLCKGLKSFGNIILFLGMLPIIFLAVIAVKLLIVVDFAKLQKVFTSTEFDEFLVNSKTWSAAAQEAFLTWGLLGASIIAISSRTHKTSSGLTLRSDAILVVLVTLIGLSLSALVGLCSIQIVNESGYVYVPGSYENPDHYSAIFSLNSSPNSDISYPTKFVPHYSTLIGEVYRRHTDIKNVSGYQVLRFVTELLPAAVAISTENISWIWTSIIFITFFLFGVSQLCVMWKPISCALGNSSSAVLLSCFTGLLLSIPFATEIGITLLHYMDILLGGAWFMPVLWAAEIFGVFLIRGRPYNGDDLVNDLKMSGSMSAFLALSWNVLLPIGLITLAVIEYKTSLSSQLYYWRGKSYFSYWSRKVGALTQIGFLLLVPIAAITQIYRYLTSGPPDILDRIQMLYRPLDNVESIRTTNRNILHSRYRNENHNNSAIGHFEDDAPPKYTPPPSYTTATGARLSKMLRQTLRRSVRRILGECERPRPTLGIQHETLNEQASYTSALSSRSETANEMNTSINEAIEIENRPSLNLLRSRSLSLGRKQLLNKRRFKEEIERPLSAQANTFDSHSNRRFSRTLNERPYTAEDVITILRSSTLGRRRVSHSVHPQTESVFRSIENLVENAEPPNLSSGVINEYPNQNSTSVI
ncbi:sodium-dependent transporter bedraggled isoform X2 [Calliphora vicina]|uniref:sodium-dependent transporter bedraggled isoform X2 n=1 Tax=Calliphora vicina TaxID=7373 RepID=UPI00325BB31B